MVDSASGTSPSPAEGTAKQVKQLKSELRISKKAEQIAKEKLTKTKKELEKLQ